MLQRGRQIEGDITEGDTHSGCSVLFHSGGTRLQSHVMELGSLHCRGVVGREPASLACGVCTYMRANLRCPVKVCCLLRLLGWNAYICM